MKVMTKGHSGLGQAGSHAPRRARSYVKGRARGPGHIEKTTTMVVRDACQTHSVGGGGLWDDPSHDATESMNPLNAAPVASAKGGKSKQKNKKPCGCGQKMKPKQNRRHTTDSRYYGCFN